IKDITFKDVTFTAELWNPQVIEYSAGVLAGRVTERTVIENVTVTGTFQYAITTKGWREGDNHFEATQVDWAIGYRFHDAAGNETVDMSKYQANIDGAQVQKYEFESIEKDKFGNAVFPEMLPPKDEE
ncbi:MAG: hypothetical protein K2N74_05825, partial [Clostridiales bacterium]|nr:hypothetical protein [Clostridiales bacterium]